jgi:hypothetical protein
LLGGTITATHIHKLVVKPANELVQTPQNPLFGELDQQLYPTYIASPGYSLTNANVTSSGSIDKVRIVGTQLNSEVKTGFDYPSFIAGLQGTRARSQVRRLRLNGDQINSVTSATFRPANHNYSFQTGVAGPGKITGHSAGSAYNTNGLTGLGNTGAGYFARKRSRGLLPLR